MICEGALEQRKHPPIALSALLLLGTGDKRTFSVIMSSVCAEAEVEGGPAAILLAKLAWGGYAGPPCILR